MPAGCSHPNAEVTRNRRLTAISDERQVRKPLERFVSAPRVRVQLSSLPMNQAAYERLWHLRGPCRHHRRQQSPKFVVQVFGSRLALHQSLSPDMNVPENDESGEFQRTMLEMMHENWPSFEYWGWEDLNYGCCSLVAGLRQNVRFLFSYYGLGVVYLLILAVGQLSKQRCAGKWHLGCLGNGASIYAYHHLVCPRHR